MHAHALVRRQGPRRGGPDHRIDRFGDLINAQHFGQREIAFRSRHSFDGGGGVTGCSDVSQMFHVTMEMLRRGYSEKTIRKIWGGNAMRVLQKTIDLAAAPK